MNIRSILAAQLGRYPTEAMWEELEAELEHAVFARARGDIDRRTLLSAPGAQRIVRDWQRRHRLFDD